MTKPYRWKMNKQRMPSPCKSLFVVAKKIKLPWISLLFFSFMVVAGFGKSMIQIFFLVSFHELFHIVCAVFLRYDVTSIVVYPFGLGMQLKGIEYRHSMEEIIIAMAGLISYVFSVPLMYLFLRWEWISRVNYSWMMQINTSILLFNSLPVYPLDGGRIVHGMIHMFLPFQLAKRVTILVSVMVLLVFSWFQLKSLSMLVVVLVFLMVQLVSSWCHLPMQKRQFYIYRFLRPVTYRTKIHTFLDLYRNYANIIKINSELVPEDKWLKRELMGYQKDNPKRDAHYDSMPFL